MGPVIWAPAAARLSTAALTIFLASSRLPVVTCTSTCSVMAPSLTRPESFDRPHADLLKEETRERP
jgi:hypothetical protein